MTCSTGIVWEAPQHFNRFIEECGIRCDHITPHMLAAPFYRPILNCLIIPTGFANSAYSNLLPALRASAPRIQRFVENGGSLLVFGAAANRPDAYNWLPFSLIYQHDCHPRRVEFTEGSVSQTLIDDYDPASIECDGIFPAHEGEGVGTGDSAAVVIEKTLGKGRIIVTTIHEYPSRTFLKKICADGSPTQL